MCGWVSAEPETGGMGRLRDAASRRHAQRLALEAAAAAREQLLLAAVDDGGKPSLEDTIDPRSAHPSLHLFPAAGVGIAYAARTVAQAT